MSLWQRLYELEQKLYNQSGSQIKQFTVSSLADLLILNTAPPALVYVKETGEYYKKHFIDNSVQATPYASAVNGWVALDVSVPRYDRRIHVVKHKWVRTAGYTQDLDYMNAKEEGNGIWGGGMPGYILFSMPEPEPPGNFIELPDVVPGDLVLRLGLEDPSDIDSELKPEDNKWYMISVEVLDHGDDSHKNLDHRTPYCWNVMYLADSTAPSRFDRIMHRASSDAIFEANNKTIPGDFVYRDDEKLWYYLLPPVAENLIEVEITRHITVKNRDRFNWLIEGFDLKHLFVINLTHEKQNWQREIPQTITADWQITTIPWRKKHYPADFCYWGNE